MQQRATRLHFGFGTGAHLGIRFFSVWSVSPSRANERHLCAPTYILSKPGSEATCIGTLVCRFFIHLLSFVHILCALVDYFAFAVSFPIKKLALILVSSAPIPSDCLCTSPAADDLLHVLTKNWHLDC